MMQYLPLSCSVEHYRAAMMSLTATKVNAMAIAMATAIATYIAMKTTPNAISAAPSQRVR